MNSQLQPSLAIREMKLDDIFPVLAIEQMSHVAPWTEAIFRDCLRVGYRCEVLVKEGIVIGYAIMSVAAEEAHVFNVCVTPTEQSLGYGRLLMNHCLDTARQSKAQSMFLEVRPSNEIAIYLYEDLGFQEVGVRKDYYPAPQGREDALIMARHL